VLSQLENGDELPDCFLECSRLGRALPCAIRLRTQRSDHVAVTWEDPNGAYTRMFGLCPRYYEPDLTADPNRPFVRDAVSLWL
jgi:hypothetical protein